MEDTVEKINLNHLDKSNWETYRFEEIARKISETVDPNTTTLQTYVGLEHIDPEDIHIRRFGSPDDVSGGKLKCYPGDVIFGKRRAYQRKAAIVDFEGICSAHAFVFRANPEVIDPQLFPFFLHSDQFMHRMVDISVGGLSPTINWGDLKHQQFLLPPKSEQARLTELLWALDEVIEREREVLERLKNTYNILVDNLFTLENQDWNYFSLKTISKINKNSLKSNNDPDYEFKYLDIAGIIEPKKIGELQTIKFKDAPSRARRITADNSIILSMVRPYHKAFAFLEDSRDIIASTGTSVIEVNKDYNPKFVFHQFFSTRFMKFCEDRMTGTNYPAITQKDLESFTIALPNDLNLIEVVSNKLDSLDKSENQIKDKIESSKALQKSLINQIF